MPRCAVVVAFMWALSSACTSSNRTEPEVGAASLPAGPNEPIAATTGAEDTAETTAEMSAETTAEVVDSAIVPRELDGFFMAEGAPQPRACVAASDCLGDTIPDLAQPCCANPRSLQAHAYAYKRWIGSWRTEHCAGVVCPPPPAPAMPPRCAFEVDCVAGVCVDGCE